MKKAIILFKVILLSMSVNYSANAVLANTATLLFEPGIVTIREDTSLILSGSYFALDVNGDNFLSSAERTAISMNDGLQIGVSQFADGAHDGLPSCNPAIDFSCTNFLENPGIDAPWSIFRATGMHLTTSDVNILSTNSNMALVDFSGWSVNWFNSTSIVNLGSGAWNGNAEGVATILCDVDCGNGDRFTLEYSATVAGPVNSSDIDFNVFADVKYILHLEGVVSTVPVPAAIWLFLSGFIGLFGFVRKK